jgi:hypothetical protein
MHGATIKIMHDQYIRSIDRQLIGEKERFP